MEEIMLLHVMPSCRHFSVVAEDRERERELKEETSLQKVQDDAPCECLLNPVVFIAGQPLRQH